MKIIVVIPARYGSTRFEGKPLALIAGKPMIRRVYEASKAAENINDVIVATDDTRILDAVEAFGGKGMITSRTNRSGTDRAGEVAERLGLAPDDIVINVQGDQPLLEPKCLEQVIQPFFSEPGAEMSTLAFRIINPEEITNPKHVKTVFDEQGNALYFSRSPIPFGREADVVFDTYKHLGIYAYTRQFLETYKALPEGRLEAIEKLEQLRVLEYGYRISVVVTEYNSPEVDLPEDIGIIEKLLEQRG
ncbi:3-deoxy-manno-octulosonate cytidylyltransferase [Desulfonema ishimotonii]|uniref:3-deoxy-manno-octulosonate cytidylyltransferase n=1 Tax=Desulfonema ishimotonii TaxID=45657 RepID=A0A401FVR3_9BACT|nr:3-deoxy-manno-octulosonate cytidylyltransferase [Desulfonema ishimotonii]GBC61072.1 3-deoxy-manno-octulosonate cytidylyltransferase [Desulfonema ishimotonii]